MSWTVTTNGFDKNDHPLQEALTTLGNGYVATRGALEMLSHKYLAEKSGPPSAGQNKSETANGHDTKAYGASDTPETPKHTQTSPKAARKDWNYPATYLAGGYNRMKSKVQDKVIENEDLVNWPNWLYMTFSVDNERWFDPEAVEMLAYNTDLLLKEGILQRTIRFQDHKGRITKLVSRRIISMHDYHMAAIHWTICPENWSGRLRIRSGIDGHIINDNVERYRGLNQNHTEVTNTGSFGNDGLYLECCTKQSQVSMVQGVQTSVYCDNQRVIIEPALVEEAGFIANDYIIECDAKKLYHIEKTCAIFTSRDFAISDPLTGVMEALNRGERYDRLERLHIQSWSQIWQFNDLEVDTQDNLDQLVLRLHIFHLYQTASTNSIDYDIGIPARGWHGEAYRGHIFWDELYILPFINLHYPQLSRSLLMYRYRRLPQARQAAREAGYRGAMFPWQSGSNGREETQKLHLNPESGRWLPDVSHLQFHINAAIPYNVWHYYQSTDDMDFLLSHGAEIILSTALFWSSISSYNDKRERYEILRVMGPDEYHTHYPDDKEPGLNNNAYTNIMAVWVLQRALDLLDLFDESCLEHLKNVVGYTDEDTRKWQDISEKMFVPMHDNGLIQQFEGYEALDELDWSHYHKKYGYSIRLDRILESEGDSCNRYKAGKQADVLMLFYLFSVEELQQLFERLGYSFQPETIPFNIDYYRKRTAHGSTLSQIIHAWVYARSRRGESWKRFRKALMSDFQDVQGGTTHEGIHLGAMAGTLDIMQRCYTGLEIRDDVLWFNPRLPDDVANMKLHLRYRSHWIVLEINHDFLDLTVDKGWAEPITIAVNGEKHQLNTGDHKRYSL